MIAQWVYALADKFDLSSVFGVCMVEGEPAPISRLRNVPHSLRYLNFGPIVGVLFGEAWMVQPC